LNPQRKAGIAIPTRTLNAFPELRMGDSDHDDGEMNEVLDGTGQGEISGVAKEEIIFCCAPEKTVGAR